MRSLTVPVIRRAVPSLLSAALVLAFALAVAGQAGGQAAPESGSKPDDTKAALEGSIVKTGNGQPLRGARVSLIHTTATDASGLDSLPDIKSQAALEMTGNVVMRSGPLATVLADPATASQFTTDATGHFRFEGVAPGNYRLTVQADGYLTQEYGQRTPTGPGTALFLESGKRITVDLRMTSASIISGRVYDAEGEPLQRTLVQAYAYRYNEGRRTLASIASGQTNDLGEYRLYWLQPGDYFVAVSPPGGPANPGNNLPQQSGGARSMAFIAISGNGPSPSMIQLMGTPGNDSSAIFYPGVANPADAEMVHVGPAADVQRIDFHLRPQRTVSISGRIVAAFSLASSGVERRIVQAGSRPPGADGGTPGLPPQAQTGFAISIQSDTITAAGPGGALPGPQLALAGGPPIELTLTRAGTTPSGPLGRDSTPVRPDGTFQFENVTSGSYTLVAIAKDPNGKQHTAQVAVETGNDDVRDLVVTLAPGHDIAGRIYVDPPPPDSFKMANLRVNLTPDSSPMTLPPLPGGDFFLEVATPGGVFPGGDTISATVDEDGVFMLKDVASALGYRIRVTGIPSGGYLLEGRLGSADALAGSVNGADPEASLRLQIGFSGGAVSGTVVDGSDKPYATAIVALVPEKSRTGRADLYFSTTSDATGRYNFSNVPPGPYRLFAWTEIPSGAFRSPEFLTKFEERALSGAVESRGAWTETLKVIPTSQP